MSDTGTHAITPAWLRTVEAGDTMYKPEFTPTGVSKHSRLCQSSFGRRDWNCHRCVELILGAAPRGGWQHEYFARKLRQVQRSFDFPKLE